MKKHLLCLVGLLLAVMPSQASTIMWGSVPGDSLYTSYGQPLDNNFVFELGTFGSFIPTLANAELWESNWRMFDRAVAPALDGWNSGAGFVNSSATLTSTFQSDSVYASSSDFFSQGEQIFIWAYNTLVYAEGAEWALVTNDSSDGVTEDDWVFPDPVCCGESTLDLRMEDATSVPLGGVNDERGPGNFSADPGTYALQTAAVPEPGAAFLISALGFASLFRRKRTA